MRIASEKANLFMGDLLVLLLMVEIEMKEINQFGINNNYKINSF